EVVATVPCGVDANGGAGNADSRRVDGPRRVDGGENHHLVSGQEHLLRPPFDGELRLQRERRRRPAGGGVERGTGQHENPRPVILDEVRLIHPRHLGGGGGVGRGAGRVAGSGWYRRASIGDAARVEVALLHHLQLALHLQ